MTHKTLACAMMMLASSCIGIANAGNILFTVEEPVADAVMAGISNIRGWAVSSACLLYTSDAADEVSPV